VSRADSRELRTLLSGRDLPAETLLTAGIPAHTQVCLSLRQECHSRSDPLGTQQPGYVPKPSCRLQHERRYGVLLLLLCIVCVSLSAVSLLVSLSVYMCACLNSFSCSGLHLLPLALELSLSLSFFLVHTYIHTRTNTSCAVRTRAWPGRAARVVRAWLRGGSATGRAVLCLAYCTSVDQDHQH
jgi:hypothetical protein